MKQAVALAPEATAKSEETKASALSDAQLEALIADMGMDDEDTSK